MTRLVYYDEFSDIRRAIEWEKRIKGWLRQKKVALVAERNKYWRDLAADWNAGVRHGTHSSPQAVDAPEDREQGLADALRRGPRRAASGRDERAPAEPACDDPHARIGAVASAP